MVTLPTTVDFPLELEGTGRSGRCEVELDGVSVSLSNLDKPYWRPEGYTKADLVTYYAAIAEWAVPYVRDRPLTMKRMPDGADGEFFYAKRAPSHTPGWVTTATVDSPDGKRIDYVLGQDRPTLVWLANLGCIELHPWHSRVDQPRSPDYAFFDLDPFGVGFDVVKEVALLVRAALDHLGVRGYPRTSGATGMQIYVPLDRVHSSATIREWVRRVSRSIAAADPQRTTMEFQVARRGNAVFLDHGMNTEGRSIAGTYSLRPERGAPVATPLRWEELETDVGPGDFTIATIWQRLQEVGDLLAPVLAGGQDLHASMERLGMDPAVVQEDAGHVVTAVKRPAEPPVPPVPPMPPAGAQSGRLDVYSAKRDFARTSEPDAADAADGHDPPGSGSRFVLQHHLATRLHHDLRLEHDGVAVSWAVPKGLPDVRGVRHLAIQTEDHPLRYLTFEGDIPEGEYGGGPMRIWDSGTYQALEWEDGKATIRLDGSRHRGEYHLFRTDGKQWLVIRADEPAPGELPGPSPALRPMLATAWDEPFDDPGWNFEIKWDGMRALARVERPGRGGNGSTVLCARHGNDVSVAWPELASLWERMLARNAVVDGEIVALDDDGRPSFQRLQHRMHLREEHVVARAAKRAPVTYMAFDLLAVDGVELWRRPLTERLERLDDVLVASDRVQRSAVFPGEGNALFEAVRERGLEGVVAKRTSSSYQPGRRSRDWRKIKVRREVSCVIGGWTAGEGRRSGSLGALLLGLYADGGLRHVGRAGTGFDDAELARLVALLAPLRAPDPPFAPAPRIPGARWVRPELVCRVSYGEATEAGILRAPVYSGLIPGAEPTSCTLDDLR